MYEAMLHTNSVLGPPGVPGAYDMLYPPPSRDTLNYVDLISISTSVTDTTNMAVKRCDATLISNIIDTTIATEPRHIVKAIVAQIVQRIIYHEHPALLKFLSRRHCIHFMPIILHETIYNDCIHQGNTSMVMEIAAFNPKGYMVTDLMLSEAILAGRGDTFRWLLQHDPSHILDPNVMYQSILDNRRIDMIDTLVNTTPPILPTSDICNVALMQGSLDILTEIVKHMSLYSMSCSCVESVVKDGRLNALNLMCQQLKNRDVLDSV